jgi:hypothetical protein
MIVGARFGWPNQQWRYNDNNPERFHRNGDDSRICEMTNKFGLPKFGEVQRESAKLRSQCVRARQTGASFPRPRDRGRRERSAFVFALWRSTLLEIDRFRRVVDYYFKYRDNLELIIRLHGKLAPRSMACEPWACRSQCGDTASFMPAALAALFTIALTARSVSQPLP